jgi:hypothetical protein
LQHTAGHVRYCPGKRRLIGRYFVVPGLVVCGAELVEDFFA